MAERIPATLELSVTSLVIGFAIGMLLGVVAAVRRGGIADNLMIPPPLWFWCVSLVVFLPTAWAGARLVEAPAAV